jgi:hypothetical protein
MAPAHQHYIARRAVPRVWVFELEHRDEAWLGLRLGLELALGLGVGVGFNIVTRPLADRIESKMETE